jgi:hypothetical protein
MSTNILKKLVEQFAPETVKTQMKRIEEAASAERQARFERLAYEKALLDSLPRESAKGNGRGRLFGTETAVACIS